MNIEEIQSRLSGVDGVNVVKGKGGFPVVKIQNSAATAEISLYGGQVLAYQAGEQEALLFLSDRAYYEKGKAIKGGIPVCWPAFGASFENEGRPFHGFARNRFWQLEYAERKSDSLTEVALTLEEDEESLKIFPYKFRLTLKVQVSDRLSVQLVTDNTDEKPFQITQALHTYLSVHNIEEVSLSGLDKIEYLDKAKSNTGEEHKTQQGELVVKSEVDRIYLNVPEKVLLKEKMAQRNISIVSEGNKALVVWNPWKELCIQSADLDDNDYMRFLCVETANAADDIRQVQPGESVSISANYNAELP